MDHEFGIQKWIFNTRSYEYELQQWYDEYMTKVYEAGFEDDSEAYEASWNRTFEYAQSGAIDDLLENNA